MNEFSKGDQVRYLGNLAYVVNSVAGGITINLKNVDADGNVSEREFVVMSSQIESPSEYNDRREAETANRRAVAFPQPRPLSKPLYDV